MRVIFFGTGSFGLPTLRALFPSRHTVIAVVTQPDRTGRGHHKSVNPIKDEAAMRNRPVLQPEDVNAPDSLRSLAMYRADLFVTAAYGQILKQPLLDIPPAGSINLHASLLPKYRGAAPIHAAIAAGETETGVTIFRIVRKLDAGPILACEALPIAPAETTGQLHDRLAERAAPLCLQLLDRLDRGALSGTPQDDALSSYAPQLRKEQGEIDWSQTAGVVVNHIRAMQPWPGAFTTLHIDGESSLRVQITAAEPMASPDDPLAPPGTSIPTDGALVIQTGGGPLRILRLKPAGKREMDAGDFLRGRSLPAGTRFGSA